MNSVTNNSISRARLLKKLYVGDLHKYLLSLAIRYELTNNVFYEHSGNN